MKRPIGFTADIDMHVDDNGDPVPPEQPKRPVQEPEVEVITIPKWASFISVAVAYLTLLTTGTFASYIAFWVFHSLSGTEIPVAAPALGGLIFSAVTFWHGMERLNDERDVG